MVVEFADAAEHFGVVAVVVSPAAGDDYEIVPEETALVGHFRDERVKFFFGLFVVASGKVRPLFSGTFFPRVQEHLLNRGVSFNRDAEPHT